MAVCSLYPEETMSEERYVVRDKFGAYYRPIDGGRGGAYEESERHEMDRRTAYLVVSHCLESREARVYKLKSKPKPKAPREVFVMLDSKDYRPVDVADDEHDLFPPSDGTVVRYVLAEGEK